MTSLTIMLAVFYCLARAVEIGHGSSATVASLATQTRDVRRAFRALSEDVELTSEDQMVVGVLVDGNSELTFKLPVIDALGDLIWGVESSVPGAGTELVAMAAWSIRYTVKEMPGGSKGLYRQIIEDAGEAIVKEKLVAARLQVDGGGQPAFSVAKVGDIWEISMVSVHEGRNEGNETTIHVRVQN